MKTLNKKEFEAVSKAFFNRLENEMSNSSCNDLFEDEFPKSVISKFTSDFDVYEVWKKINNEKSNIICGLAIPLSQYWYGSKMPAKHLIFIRCKSAYNLLKSKIFHTTKIEKEYQELVDKYNYSEDENGHHKINL